MFLKEHGISTFACGGENGYDNVTEKHAFVQTTCSLSLEFFCNN